MLCKYSIKIRLIERSGESFSLPCVRILSRGCNLFQYSPPSTVVLLRKYCSNFCKSTGVSHIDTMRKSYRYDTKTIGLDRIKSVFVVCFDFTLNRSLGGVMSFPKSEA